MHTAQLCGYGFKVMMQNIQCRNHVGQACHERAEKYFSNKNKPLVSHTGGLLGPKSDTVG